MQVQRIIGIALLVGGVILLIMGIQAADSVSSSISKMFTGSPTDRSMWLIVGGAICIVAGGGLAVVQGRGNRG